MATLIIKTNASQGSDVTIDDLGLLVLQSGGSITLTDEEAIQRAQHESKDLRAFLVDDAHGANSSTLILNDGSGDIAQADVLQFLEMILIPASGNFSAVQRNDAGQVAVDVEFDGTAVLKNAKLGDSLDANTFKVVNLLAGVDPTDAVNKSQLDAVSVGGKAWKEILLAREQLLDGGSGGVLSAIAFYLDGQPIANDTFILKSTGGGTETFTFKASESGAFDVLIDSTVDLTMAALAQAINDDSSTWGAVLIDALDSINDGSGSSTAGKVLVIFELVPSESSDSRIFGSITTAAFGQYVNFNGEGDYEIPTSTELPSADPAQKEFGFGRLFASLIANETHVTRSDDGAYTWDSDGEAWQNTGANGLTFSNGLVRSGNNVAPDYGEAGDIAELADTAAAGVLDEFARADHAHEHGDRGGDSAGSQHDADQIDVEATLSAIGAPAALSVVLAAIDAALKAGKFVGKWIGFGQRLTVPASGTLHLEGAGRAPSSAVGYRMLRAGKIRGASVQVDAIDATRAYKLSIRVNGVEQESVALPTSTIGAQDLSFSFAYVAGDRISAAMVNTGGAGASTFDDIQALVELVDDP